MAQKWDEGDTTAVSAIVAGALLMSGGYWAWGFDGMLFGAGLWVQSAVICRRIAAVRRKL